MKPMTDDRMREAEQELMRMQQRGQALKERRPRTALDEAALDVLREEYRALHERWRAAKDQGRLEV